ncbi:MAG: hypothetical protein E7409_01240 [Ruminococcaceae bacterium]|nr:hypothetical protein [Oscillospiraceae bacterium]
MMRALLKEQYGLDDHLIDLAERVEEKIAPQLAEVDRIGAYNGVKVLRSFQRHNISETHFAPTTGYGYDDLGRDTLDKVYADTFGAQDALVRHSIVNGTQAIASCLYGVLRPGDTLVAATGAPYDTLEEVIGIRGNGCGSLREFGVGYRQVDLLPDGGVDFDTLRKTIDPSCRAVLIQRSKGYAWRDSMSVARIGEIISFVKNIRQDIYCIVDNCYGEFVEETEPASVGADLIVGSLIKNPGGGLARSGGYVAGTKEAVEQVSYRLTCPGIGRECGATLENNRMLYQGFFMAPHTVAQSVKAAVFCGALMQELGFAVCPAPNEKRTDIIQAIRFGAPEKLVRFCQGIQAGAPVDSFVVPEPWDMPGYENQVIMAAGAFTQGSSIEISADGPIREPYIAYYQGGLTYESAKIAVLLAARNVTEG